MITPTQMRAARAMLDLSQGEVAKSLGIAANTLSNIESGKTDVPASRLKEIHGFYENRGVEFLSNGGVQPRQDIISIYKGRSGFIDFIWDVYETAKTIGGEICVSNVNEEDFIYWLGEEDPIYVEKMSALNNFKFKILSQHGDMNVSSTYAEYKWLKKDQFSGVPFYVYGQKFAMLLFEKDVSVYVIDNQDIANAQKAQFNIAWDASEIPVIQGR